MIIAGLPVVEFDRFCKMKPISNDNLRVIVIYFNNDRVITCQWINFFVIYNHPYIQDTKQYLLFTIDDNIILGSYKYLFQ